MPRQYVPVEKTWLTCRYCASQFIRTGPGGSVCPGKDCQRQRNRDKLKAFLKRQPPRVKHIPSVFCRICLTVQAKKVCSDECVKLETRYRYRVLYTSVKGTERSRAFTNEPVTKRCRECDKEFTINTNISRTFYCSPRCGDREQHRDSERLRRVRLRAKGPVKLSQIKGREIAIRDQWICQLCHKPVSPKHKYPHPMSASMDHIVPVSHGGGHEHINVQLAHWICNTLRGNKGPAQLRLLA